MDGSSKINRFLEVLCQQIRWKKAHDIIGQEIKDHIIDQKNAFVKEGLDESKAIDKAIEEMGDPVSIGSELDISHRPKTEWSIIFLVGMMLLVGFMIRAIASYEPGIPFNLERSLLATSIGIVFMTAAYFLDFTILGKYPKAIFLSLSILTMIVMLFSPVVYGRPSYVPFMLLLFPTAMAGIIYNMRNRGYLGIIISSMFIIIPIAIGIIASSLSSVILAILAFLILITISIKKAWFNVNKIKAILLLYIPVISGSALFFMKLIVGNSYRISRFKNIINPYNDPMGTGYIAIKTREMIINSKLIGRGTLGTNGYMLPNMDKDYILTYLIHRLGWIPFILLMGLIVFFVVRAFILTSRQKSVLGKLVSVSILLTFTMEVIFYTLANIGFPIISSLTLPFISYSGMSTIINMILIGVMISVFRTGDLVRDNVIDRKNSGKFLDIVDGKIIIDFNFK